MKSALIISGNLVQDHEFIYPYYRLLEEKFTVAVCLLGGQPVEGILGTKIPATTSTATAKPWIATSNPSPRPTTAPFAL